MNSELASLGITPFFTSQLTEKELEGSTLARVTEVQRSELVANDGSNEHSITLGSSWYQQASEARPTVGDWVLLGENCENILRLLERKSIFKRIAAGSKVEVQLIAANIDTLFIVTSCNEEFSESRLERYLSLAIEAGVDPVIVLTKIDLTDNVDEFSERVKSVSATAPIETVNALDQSTLSGLKAWITNQSTVALVGSSGVGKSSILNSLAGHSIMNTGPVRKQDSKGKHTTTYRALHILADGGILLDVPGMRELKVANIATALGKLFEDIEILAENCKFRDCEHEQEQGCAVLKAIDSGQLDQRRLQNHRKLRAEEARLSASLAEQRDHDRQFGKTIKAVQQEKRKSRSSW